MRDRGIVHALIGLYIDAATMQAQRACMLVDIRSPTMKMSSISYQHEVHAIPCTVLCLNACMACDTWIPCMHAVWKTHASAPTKFWAHNVIYGVHSVYLNKLSY